MKLITYYCDLCETEEIDPNQQGMAIVMYVGNYQLWEDKDGREIKICRKCCKLILRGQVMGLVSIVNEDRLFEITGFKRIDGDWVLKSPRGNITIHSTSDSLLLLVE